VSRLTRHEIREIALTLLYNAECESGGVAASVLNKPVLPQSKPPQDLSGRAEAETGENSGDLDRLYGDLDEAFGLAQSKEAKRLAAGVLSRKAEFDAIIARFSPTRQVARIPLILRAILRLALYEICCADETPDKVAINEAIELAKEYGTGSDPAFVSGLLGNFYREKSGENGENRDTVSAATENCGNGKTT
jgi:N utilization substance protein B